MSRLHHAASKDAAPVSSAIAERLITEGLLSMEDAAASLPKFRGKGVHPASVKRWAIKGKYGVYLEAVELNGPGLWTSRAALARFAAALTIAKRGR